MSEYVKLVKINNQMDSSKYIKKYDGESKMKKFLNFLPWLHDKESEQPKVEEVTYKGKFITNKTLVKGSDRYVFLVIEDVDNNIKKCLFVGSINLSKFLKIYRSLPFDPIIRNFDKSELLEVSESESSKIKDDLKSYKKTIERLSGIII